MNLTKKKGGEQEDIGSLKIISTNYDRWAIMYSCLAPMGDMMSMDFIWIYSRTQTLTEEEMMEVFGPETKIERFWLWLKKKLN